MEVLKIIEISAAKVIKKNLRNAAERQGVYCKRRLKREIRLGCKIGGHVVRA
jgi:hypothetical protein